MNDSFENQNYCQAKTLPTTLDSAEPDGVRCIRCESK